MTDLLSNNLETIALFFGIIFLTFIIASFVGRVIRSIIKRTITAQGSDPTNYQFLKRAIVGTIYVVGISAAIYTIPSLRTLAGSILAGAGILAAAIGFASQSALSNIISGVFIVMFKPFRINDRLSFRQLDGIVEDITLRHTVIRDFQNKRIVIPNSLISDDVIINSNFGDSKVIRWVNIGISYGSDMALAKKIMIEEMVKHPLAIDNRTPEQLADNAEIAAVRVIDLADSSVQLRGFVWAAGAADAFAMGCDLLESIKLRFDAEGVEIPFPHRTLVHKNLPTFLSDS